MAGPTIAMQKVESSSLFSRSQTKPSNSEGFCCGQPSRQVMIRWLRAAGGAQAVRRSSRRRGGGRCATARGHHDALLGRRDLHLIAGVQRCLLAQAVGMTTWPFAPIRVVISASSTTPRAAPERQRVATNQAAPRLGGRAERHACGLNCRQRLPGKLPSRSGSATVTSGCSASRPAHDDCRTD